MNDMKYLVKVSQFVNKTFALWVIIFGILGFIFPEIFKLVGPYVPVLLGVVMFGMGLTLSTADFREVVRRPKEVLTGLVAQFTIMPLSAYALCVLLKPSGRCCGRHDAPGLRARRHRLELVTFIARGDVALSVTVTSCTTLLAPIVTPAFDVRFANQWLCHRSGFDVPFDRPDDPAPIAAGVVIHKLAGDKTLKSAWLRFRSCPLAPSWSSPLLSLPQPVPSSSMSASLIFAAVAVQNAVGMLLGWYAARFMGMSLSKRKTLAFEVGMQNSGLAVALATLHFAAAPATAPAGCRSRPLAQCG